MLCAIAYGPVLYPVDSAYNGAVLYPMKSIRNEGVRYSTDASGQLCEHIGFHTSIAEQMYINRKWEMVFRLDRPAGPSGSSGLHVMLGYLSQVLVHLKVVLPILAVNSAFAWSALVTLEFGLVTGRWLLRRGQLWGWRAVWLHHPKLPSSSQ